jgi:hypothetical protein
MVLWVMMPCGLNGGYQQLREMYCLHLNTVTLYKTTRYHNLEDPTDNMHNITTGSHSETICKNTH